MPSPIGKTLFLVIAGWAIGMAICQVIWPPRRQVVVDLEEYRPRVEFGPAKWVEVPSVTKKQLQKIAPASEGTVYYCSDCADQKVFVAGTPEWLRIVMEKVK